MFGADLGNEQLPQGFAHYSRKDRGVVEIDPAFRLLDVRDERLGKARHLSDIFLSETRSAAGLTKIFSEDRAFSRDLSAPPLTDPLFPCPHIVGHTLPIRKYLTAPAIYIGQRGARAGLNSGFTRFTSEDGSGDGISCPIKTQIKQ